MTVRTCEALRWGRALSSLAGDGFHDHRGVRARAAPCLWLPRGAPRGFHGRVLLLRPLPLPGGRPGRCPAALPLAHRLWPRTLLGPVVPRGGSQRGRGCHCRVGRGATTGAGTPFWAANNWARRAAFSSITFGRAVLSYSICPSSRCIPCSSGVGGRVGFASRR